jgi:putative peptidoglycan lipid II flippase
MFFLQIFFIARDHLASGMGEGAVTALNYGWFIMQVPETLIGTAIAIALLPTLSEQFTRGEMGSFQETVNRAVRSILALTLPAAALLAVALPPLVRRVFGFDEAGTNLVVWATRAYLLGLIGNSLLEVASRSFYAQQDARTPLYASALNAGVYILFATLLSRSMGITGIALANTLAFTGEALLLLYLLNRRLPGLLRVGSTFGRVLLASLAAGALVLVLLRIPVAELPMAIASLAAGGVLVTPFIWPELKLLVKL